MSEEDRVGSCCHVFRERLEQLNHEKANEVYSHLEAAVGNVIANARWNFLDGNNPNKFKKVTDKSPLMYK